MDQLVRRVELRRVRAAFAISPPFPQITRDRARERIDGIELDAVDQCGFVGILHRHDEFGEAGVARAQNHRQDAADRLQFSIEREFAERDELLQREPVDLFVHGDQRERHRDVERRAGFTHVRRREIDEQAARRIGEAGVDDRRAHAVATPRPARDRAAR